MKDFTALQTALDDDAYQRRILQGVSRTFALTIPALPGPLCRVVGNAYLLCRIADTIEDDQSLPAAEKHDCSAQFVRAVSGGIEVAVFARALLPRLAPGTPETERDLIANAAAVVRVTHSFSAAQRAALTRCVCIMAEGMSRYQRQATLDGLSDMSEMECYCYHVAGVVGEMLTELFCDYSPAVRSQRAQLMHLAVSFGQVLQMTNILKDVWEDHARGACWLPRDVFAKQRYDIRRKAPGQRHAGYARGMGELIAIAHGHLSQALRYTLLLPRQEVGMRRFCLWALGMAVLTLDRIHGNPHFTSGREVKISRRSVRLTVLLCTLHARHDRMLRWLFKLAARRLPLAAVGPTAAPNA